MVRITIDTETGAAPDSGLRVIAGEYDPGGAADAGAGPGGGQAEYEYEYDSAGGAQDGGGPPAWLIEAIARAEQDGQDGSGAAGGGGSDVADAGAGPG